MPAVLPALVVAIPRKAAGAGQPGDDRSGSVHRIVGDAASGGRPRERAWMTPGITPVGFPLAEPASVSTPSSCIGHGFRSW